MTPVGSTHSRAHGEGGRNPRHQGDGSGRDMDRPRLSGQRKHSHTRSEGRPDAHQNVCCGNSSRAPTGHQVTRAASSPSLSETGTELALRLGQLSPTRRFHTGGSGTQRCPSCLKAGPVNGRSRPQPSVPPWPARAHAEAPCAKSQQSRSAGTRAEEPGVGPGVVATNRRDEPHAAYSAGKVWVMKTVRHTRRDRRSQRMEAGRVRR